MAERLRDMQALFLAGVMCGDAAAEALIIDDNRVGAARRLDIYRNNYRASLTGILADHYERLVAYLGEAQFARIAGLYAEAHPSTTRNLRYYGDQFAAFLESRFPGDGELAELAALDWALRDAFDAAEAEALDAVRVGAMGDGWTEAALTLVPAVRLLSVHYNVAAIWNALEAGDAPPGAVRGEQAESVLVWRRGTRPQYRSLPSDEAAALALVAAGCGFVELSEAMLGRMGEAAAMQALGGWLGQWLADGLLMLAGQEADTAVT